MEYTEELKSLFPIGKLFTPQLLRSSTSILGPLYFNPDPETLTLLFSQAPCLHLLCPPPPKFSLTRFLSTSSSLPLSTSSSIASQFDGPHQHPIVSHSDQLYNRLQLLHCPFNNTAIVFFPTGSNNDQIGFLVISYNDSHFDVLSSENDTVFTVKNRFNNRICGILVNPVEDISGLGCDSLTTVVGYLLAFTMYSVHWFSVKVSIYTKTTKTFVDYLGFKLFKTCSIVGACWSPHLPEESVVFATMR